jgi:putative FmdB family regulatory protein
MPLYEYVCEKDGATLELLRPIAEADKPVKDPEGKGRVFKRVQSTFAAKGDPSGGPKGVPVGGGGCCPCGKSHGSCSRG